MICVRPQCGSVDWAPLILGSARHGSYSDLDMSRSLVRAISDELHNVLLCLSELIA
jgi:hypothetical protein